MPGEVWHKGDPADQGGDPIQYKRGELLFLRRSSRSVYGATGYIVLLEGQP